MGLRNALLRRRKNKFKKKYKVGLCLSGGGARGFAHLGALKAFEEHNIVFDAVAGTSVGSLFGAIYANHLPFEKVKKFCYNIKTKDFRQNKFNIMPSKMDKLAELVTSILPTQKIEDFPTPFYAVAVDLKTGKEVDFNSGDAASVITGSCAVPGVFFPVKYKNMLLVDGGVKNNIPADVLRKNGCDFVVTIDCNSTRGSGTNSTNFIKQFIVSIGVMMVNNSSIGLTNSDIIIQPEMSKYESMRINDKEGMIEAGYNAAMQMMPQIEKLFEGKFKKQ